MQSLSGTELHSTRCRHKWDLELCEFAEKNLYTAVVSDSLDQLGVRGQAMREYSASGARTLHVRGMGANDRVLGHLPHTRRSLQRSRSKRWTAFCPGKWPWSERRSRCAMLRGANCSRRRPGREAHAAPIDRRIGARRAEDRRTRVSGVCHRHQAGRFDGAGHRHRVQRSGRMR